jgi:enoyl-CoA hydratase
MTDLVRSTTDSGVVTVTLCDVARRNALSREMVEQLVAAVEAAEADPAAGCLVITGDGPAFCAGASREDLKAPNESGLRAIYRGFLRVAESPLPSVAAVNGPAVGAGFNLALACDLRVAAVSARFDARFLRLGIHPGGGHTWMLRRAVGQAAATAIVLFSEVIDGPAAERLGLVWRCVPEDELAATAHRLASQVARVDPELARRTKRTMAAMAGVPTHEAAVEEELEAQLWSVTRPGYRS